MEKIFLLLISILLSFNCLYGQNRPNKEREPLKGIPIEKASDLFLGSNEKLIFEPLESSQPQNNEDEEKEKAENQKILNALKKVKVGGTLLLRYINSATSGVDYNGKDYDNGGKNSSNSFDLKRMRISVNAEITNKISVGFMANFAEFKGETKTKVLENAFLAYKHNKYLNLKVGQFTPAIGLENTYSVNIVKSLDFSNQRYGLAGNGWGSFQLGAELSGKVDLSKIPMTYAVAFVNGNNRNNSDEDHGKLFSGRTAFRLSEKYNFNVGLNGGWGRFKDQDTYMATFDAKALFPVTNDWSISAEGQIGQGTNHSKFFGAKEVDRLKSLSDNIMRGWYVLPAIKYELGNKGLHAIEFACRYEEWEENKLLDNKRTTIIPAINFEFLKTYSKLRFMLALEINKYQNSNDKTRDSNIVYGQLQASF